MKDLEHEPDEHFGGCPECGGNDGFINVNRVHYFVCHLHNTQWEVGQNLFSGWREETPEVWERNRQIVDSYTEVEPRRFRSARFETAYRKAKRNRCGTVVPIRIEFAKPRGVPVDSGGNDA